MRRRRDQRPPAQVGDQERHPGRAQRPAQFADDRIHGLDRGRRLGRFEHPAQGAPESISGGHFLTLGTGPVPSVGRDESSTSSHMAPQKRAPASQTVLTRGLSLAPRTPRERTRSRRHPRRPGWRRRALRSHHRLQDEREPLAQGGQRREEPARGQLLDAPAPILPRIVHALSLPSKLLTAHFVPSTPLMPFVERPVGRTAVDRRRRPVEPPVNIPSVRPAVSGSGTGSCPRPAA